MRAARSDEGPVLGRRKGRRLLRSRCAERAVEAVRASHPGIGPLVWANATAESLLGVIVSDKGFVQQVATGAEQPRVPSVEERVKQRLARGGIASRGALPAQPRSYPSLARAPADTARGSVRWATTFCWGLVRDMAAPERHPVQSIEGDLVFLGLDGIEKLRAPAVAVSPPEGSLSGMAGCGGEIDYRDDLPAHRWFRDTSLEEMAVRFEPREVRFFNGTSRRM